MTTKKYHNGGSWTTQDEIDHLADLGSFNLNSHRTSRLVWLQAYLDAMPLRVDWQKIDQCVVRAEAMRLIGLEQQQMRQEHAA